MREEGAAEDHDLYAAIMHLWIDPDRGPDAAAAFTGRLLPRVAAADGFVAGHWVDPVDGAGLGFVLFETREQAAAAMPPQADWAAPGVVIQRVDIRRIAASA